MKRANQHISGFFFAALISLPLLFIIGLHIAQWRAQHVAKENLEKAFQQTIVLRARDLHWEKKGKELRIGKQLFDVKLIEYEDGYVVVTGLYDEAEMGIEKKINNTTGSGNAFSISLLVLMQSFVAMHFVWLVINTCASICKFRKFLPPFYISPFLLVPSPPPLMNHFCFKH